MRAIRQISYTGSVQTSASGATPVNLGDRTSDGVTIINQSGTSISVKTANSSVFIPLLSGASLSLSLAGNISEVQIKRTDESNSQVTVHFVSVEITQCKPAEALATPLLNLPELATAS